jgi:CRISPR-associated protein Cmr5
MNKKRIEKLIADAMKELEKLVDEKSGKIPKVYESYISAFGPSVITAGLLQCVKFYEGDDKRKKVTKIFYELLKEVRDDCTEPRLDTYLEKENRFSDYGIRETLLDIAVACKLAVRTFELDEQKEE